mmetsp:Transcript_14685/g.18129  ORF Transcript_14685/g.18129 Transcript_14685/m.18129 type:complete len:2254 (-) Transcript_14685:698-7459(-)
MATAADLELQLKKATPPKQSFPFSDHVGVKFGSKECKKSFFEWCQLMERWLDMNQWRKHYRLKIQQYLAQLEDHYQRLLSQGYEQHLKDVGDPDELYALGCDDWFDAWKAIWLWFEEHMRSQIQGSKDQELDTLINNYETFTADKAWSVQEIYARIQQHVDEIQKVGNNTYPINTFQVMQKFKAALLSDKLRESLPFFEDNEEYKIHHGRDSDADQRTKLMNLVRKLQDLENKFQINPHHKKKKPARVDSLVTTGADNSKPDATANKPWVKQRICKFYLMPNGCRYSDKECRFAHEELQPWVQAHPEWWAQTPEHNRKELIAINEARQKEKVANLKKQKTDKKKTDAIDINKLTLAEVNALRAFATADDSDSDSADETKTELASILAIGARDGAQVKKLKKENSQLKNQNETLLAQQEALISNFEIMKQRMDSFENSNQKALPPSETKKKVLDLTKPRDRSVNMITPDCDHTFGTRINQVTTSDNNNTQNGRNVKWKDLQRVADVEDFQRVYSGEATVAFARPEVVSKQYPDVVFSEDTPEPVKSVCRVANWEAWIGDDIVTIQGDTHNQASRGIVSYEFASKYGPRDQHGRLKLSRVDPDEYSFDTLSSGSKKLSDSVIGIVKVTLSLTPSNQEDRFSHERSYYVMDKDVALAPNTILECSEYYNSCGLILDHDKHRLSYTCFDEIVQIPLLNPTNKAKKYSINNQQTSAFIHAITVIQPSWTSSQAKKANRPKRISGNIREDNAINIRFDVPYSSEPYVFSPVNDSGPISIKPGIVPANVSSICFEVTNTSKSTRTIPQNIPIEITVDGNAEVVPPEDAGAYQATGSSVFHNKILRATILMLGFTVAAMAALPEAARLTCKAINLNDYASDELWGTQKVEQQTMTVGQQYNYGESNYGIGSNFGAMESSSPYVGASDTFRQVLRDVGSIANSVAYDYGHPVGMADAEGNVAFLDQDTGEIIAIVPQYGRAVVSFSDAGGQNNKDEDNLGYHDLVYNERIDQIALATQIDCGDWSEMVSELTTQALCNRVYKANESLTIDDRTSIYPKLDDPPPTVIDSAIDVAELNEFFRMQRSLNAKDVPVEEQIDPAPRVLDPGGHYYGSVRDIQINKDLPIEKQNQIFNLALNYSQIFVKDSEKLPAMSGVEYRTKLKPGTKPIRRKLRRYTPAERKSCWSEVSKMIEDGVIEPGHGPWAANCVFVPKPDGSLRQCVNYTGVNKCTIFDSYPIPNQTEQLIRLKGCNYMFSCDAWSGFWQIPIPEEERDVLAFITPFGLFRPTRMMFGGCNNAQVFQRALNQKFEDLIINNTVNIYIDDISGGRSDWDEFINDLTQVFQRCKDENIMLKPKKCKLGFSSIKHLGRVISGDEISVDPEHAVAVMNLPDPKTQKELQRWLGMVNWHREYLNSFGIIAAPLYELIGKSKPMILELTAAHRMIFAKLRTMMGTIPTLYLPDMEKPFTIQVDASKIGFGAALMQRDENNNLRIVAYYSRPTTEQERRWAHPNRLEGRALVWAVDKASTFLRGRPFTIWTDCRNLLWILNSDVSHGMASRWIIKLADYQFDLEHKQVPIADCLSRNPAFENMVSTLVVNDEKCIDTLPPVPISINFVHTVEPDINDESTGVEETKNDKNNQQDDLLQSIDLHTIRESQKVDEFCLEVIKDLQENEGGNYACDGYSVDHNGLVRKKYVDNSGEYLTVYLPQSLRAAAVYQLHNSLLTGHLGQMKTRALVRRQFDFPKIHSMVKKCVRSCPICQVVKRQRPKRRHGSLYPIGYSQPMEVLSVDFVGPISPKTRNGNQYILVFMCNFSNYAWFIPTVDCKADTVAKHMLDICLQFGFPKKLLSDRGSAFIANVYTELLALARVKGVKTTAYHPQTNGKNEVSHRLLMDLVRAWLPQSGITEWDMFLQYFAYAVNTSPVDATEHTPFSIMFPGRQPYSMEDIGSDEFISTANISLNDCIDANIFNSVPKNFSAHTPIVRDVVKKFEKSREFLVGVRERNQKLWKQRRSNEVTLKEFTPGEQVLVYVPTSVPEISIKLLNQYRGPYFVVGQSKNSLGEKIPNVYNLEDVRSGKALKNINIQHMVKYYPKMKPFLPNVNIDSEEQFILSSGTEQARELRKKIKAKQKSTLENPDVITDIDELVNGDLIVVKHPTKKNQFCVVKITHLDYLTRRISGQYYSTTAKNIKTAVFKAEYYDPEKNQSHFTNSPLARFTPALSYFYPHEILSRPFQLTKAGNLPSFVYSDLCAKKLIKLILILPK